MHPLLLILNHKKEKKEEKSKYGIKYWNLKVGWKQMVLEKVVIEHSIMVKFHWRVVMLY
jgi:hypothetical protein